MFYFFREERWSVTPCRIVLCDDHDLFREQLKKFCTEMGDIEIVGEAGDGLELLEILRRSEAAPDIVLLDISMPKLNGIEATRKIKMLHPDVKVLILTVHKDREYVRQAFSAGASGYLLKDDLTEGLRCAMKKIFEGGTFNSTDFLDEL
jgi:two-component system response regulator DegU